MIYKYDTKIEFWHEGDRSVGIPEDNAVLYINLYDYPEDQINELVEAIHKVIEEVFDFPTFTSVIHPDPDP